MRRTVQVFTALVSSFFISGCGAEGGNGLTHAISSDANAKTFIHMIIQQAKAALDSKPADPNNTTANHVINGTSGTVTLMGKANSQDNDCGTDCTSTTSDEDYEISFENYENAAGTISSGKISYHRHHYSRQNGLNYSSSESYTIKSLTPVHAKIIEYTYEEEVHGLSDTVEFSGTSSSGLTSFTGTCTNEKGETYSY